MPSRQAARRFVGKEHGTSSGAPLKLAEQFRTVGRTTRILLALPLIIVFCGAAPQTRKDTPSGLNKTVKGLFPFCGFVESGGRFTILHGVYFFGGQPSGMNAKGQIADPYLGVVDAVTGAVTPIAVPGAKVTAPFGINDAGTVVGYYFNGSVDQGFLDRAGTFTTIVPPSATWTVAYGINAAGEVVGYYLSGSKTRGFVYHDGAFSSVDFPGARYTIPTGINDRGDIVGIQSDGKSEHGFLDSGGTFTRIDHPDATWTDIYGIDNEGRIAGRFFNKRGAEEGFLDKSGAFTAIDFPGAVSTDAQGINDEGNIVGTARLRNVATNRRGYSPPCPSR